MLFSIIFIETIFYKKIYYYIDSLIIAPYHLILSIYRLSHQSYFFLDFIHILRNE